MSIDLADFETRAREAVKHFWAAGAQAAEAQAAQGRSDQGRRSAVTAGKNLDGFVQLLSAIVSANGLSAADLRLSSVLATLPGFFRPTKRWDIVVIHEKRLVAVHELKSQVGSFGNNFNNRCEEALGSATDFWTAYRENAFGQDVPRPFLGYLMLLEDCPAVHTPVRDQSPNFPILPDFASASYAQRYDVLCRKLVQEGLYSAAALLLSTREEGKTSGDYSEVSATTSLRILVATFAAHIAASAQLSA